MEEVGKTQLTVMVTPAGPSDSTTVRLSIFDKRPHLDGLDLS